MSTMVVILVTLPFLPSRRERLEGIGSFTSSCRVCTNSVSFTIITSSPTMITGCIHLPAQQQTLGRLMHNHFSYLSISSFFASKKHERMQYFFVRLVLVELFLNIISKNGHLIDLSFLQILKLTRHL